MVCVQSCSPHSTLTRSPTLYINQLQDKDIVAYITNWSSLPSSDVSFNLEDIGYKLKTDEMIQVRDLWAQKDIGVYKAADQKKPLVIKAIPAHGTKVFRFTRLNKDFTPIQ